MHSFRIYSVVINSTLVKSTVLLGCGAKNYWLDDLWGGSSGRGRKEKKEVIMRVDKWQNEEHLKDVHLNFRWEERKTKEAIHNIGCTEFPWPIRPINKRYRRYCCNPREMTCLKVSLDVLCIQSFTPTSFQVLYIKIELPRWRKNGIQKIMKMKEKRNSSIRGS